jgi:hypothetical protein
MGLIMTQLERQYRRHADISNSKIPARCFAKNKNNGDFLMG